MNVIPSLLNSFLTVYFYNIEQLLNENKNGLEIVKFQSEEANTDEHLKRYFQVFLSNHNSISNVKLKKLSIKSDTEKYIIDIDSLKIYEVTKVLLPEELSSEQKVQINKSKKSVYTNPDLYLEITDGNAVYYESVELKSTKDNTIPGSSVQQVSPFEWVIFVKRNKENVVVTTGFYINTITEKLHFPDRSPRPQVGFNTLSDWNRKYRKIENEILTIENIAELNSNKIKLLTDWQDYLASEWIEIVLSVEKSNTEKWFNNTIRKFALKLLEYNQSLDENQKESLKFNLTKLIR